MNSVKILYAFYGAEGAASILSCSRASIYRGLKKKSIDPRPKTVKPLWIVIDPEWLYRYVKQVSLSLGALYEVDSEDLADYLLNFAYRSNVEKKRNPRGWLSVALKSCVTDYLQQHRLLDRQFDDSRSY